MILAVHTHKLNFLTENTQGVEQLDALAHRHISVGRAVKQQQRSVYLVGVEQRGLSVLQLLA